VFRYTPSPVEENLPKPEDDSDEVAEWFNTQTDPAIAQAVAKAEAEARVPVQGPGYTPPEIHAPTQPQPQQLGGPPPGAPGAHSL
jgi:hypothetical protein